MASTLSRIPLEGRRRLAATLALFASLFIAVGAVATTGPGGGGIRIFAGLAFAVAALLALTAWGVLRSVRLDLAERHLDDAITRSVAAHGGLTCGCGHDHDANEMHVQHGRHSAQDSSPDHVCEQDGSGVGCSHSCDVCVLASMRPSPTATRAVRAAGRSPG